MTRQRPCVFAVGAVLVLGLLAGTVEAATLACDRNTEADVDHYNVYACFPAGCTVLQTSAMKQPITIPQPAVGGVPSAAFPIAGLTGTVAVSAVDTSGNESGLSVAVPFDAKAPAVPVNPRLLP